MLKMEYNKTTKHHPKAQAYVPSCVEIERTDNYLCLMAVVFFGFLLGIAIIVVHM